MEIRSAKKCFDRAIEYRAVNPYVERWDETAFVGPSPLKGIGNLDDIVLTIWREHPRHLIFPTALAEGLRIRFREQRDLKPPNRKSLKQLFTDDVMGNLADYLNVGVEQNAKSFADWVYSDPRRCPGFRLHFEAYHEFLANTRDVPDDNDIPDCAHIYAIPYVDAITFDRRWRGYCTGIAKKLRKLVPGLNYADKIHPNLKAILQAYP